MTATTRPTDDPSPDREPGAEWGDRTSDILTQARDWRDEFAAQPLTYAEAQTVADADHYAMRIWCWAAWGLRVGTWFNARMTEAYQTHLAAMMTRATRCREELARTLDTVRMM